MGGFSHFFPLTNHSCTGSWVIMQQSVLTNIFSHLFFKPNFPPIFKMKLRERIKENKAFKEAYRTANRDEKIEMIRRYELQHGQNRFIKRINNKYSREYWSKW